MGLRSICDTSLDVVCVFQGQSKDEGSHSPFLLSQGRALEWRELTKAARALRRHVLPVEGALTGVHEDCDSIQVFLRVHFILPIL